MFDCCDDAAVRARLRSYIIMHTDTQPQGMAALLREWRGSSSVAKTLAASHGSVRKLTKKALDGQNALAHKLMTMAKKLERSYEQ